MAKLHLVSLTRCDVCVVQSTPLHLAAGYNRTRIVQLILQNGADVHAKDKGYVSKIRQFNTPLNEFHIYV